MNFFAIFQDTRKNSPKSSLSDKLDSTHRYYYPKMREVLDATNPKYKLNDTIE